MFYIWLCLSSIVDIYFINAINLYLDTKQRASLSADQLLKAQKYIKWAGNAINYDDIPTTIENLQKALCLITTGQDS